MVMRNFSDNLIIKVIVCSYGFFVDFIFLGVGIVCMIRF